MKLSLVIPAHNEEMRITPTLTDYVRFFAAKYEDFEIMIVVDGNDHTDEIVKEFSKQDSRIKLIKLEERVGKGEAILIGMKSSQGDIIGFVDADNATGPDNFAKLVDAVESGATCAIGSRRMKNSMITRDQPLIRKVTSAIFNLYTRIIFRLDISDTQCGAKAFRQDAIMSVLDNIKIKEYGFDVELLWRLIHAGYEIKEVPISWRHQALGKFNYFKHGAKMGLDLLLLRLGLK